MSVVLAEIAKADTRSARDIVSAYPRYGVAELTVGQVEKHNQVVEHKPIREDRAHGEVIGSKPRAVSRELAKAARMVIIPGQVPGSGE